MNRKKIGRMIFWVAIAITIGAFIGISVGAVGEDAPEEATVPQSLPVDNAENTFGIHSGDLYKFTDKTSMKDVGVSIRGVYVSEKMDLTDEETKKIDEYSAQLQAGEGWDTSDLIEGYYYVEYQEGSGLLGSLFGAKNHIWVFVDVTPPTIDINPLNNTTAGETVKITGYTTYNKNKPLFILFVDKYGTEYIMSDSVKIDGSGSFAVDVSTAGMHKGIYKAVICDDTGTVADSTQIILKPEVLTCDVEDKDISIVDSISVSGTATGSVEKEVYVWLSGRELAAVAPVDVENRGFSEELKPEDFFWYTTSGPIVSPDMFEPGIYDLMVVNPCADGAFLYGDIDNTGMLIAAGADRFISNLKTSNNKDITYMDVININPPVITSDNVTVDIGEPVMITGTTNLSDESIIEINIFGGDVDISKITTVAGGAFEASFSDAEIDTKEPGNYTAIIEDMSGLAYEKINVSVVETEPTAPEPEPTAPVEPEAPEPTAPEPTAPVEPEAPQEVPGFAAVLSAVGVFSVAYVLKNKR